MFIEIADGQECFDAPSDADFQIVMKSPFTQVELDDPGTTMLLEFRDALGVVGSIVSDNVVTDIVTLVTPGIFTAGQQYYLAPKITIAGKVRRWTSPLTMNVKDNFTPACGGC